MKSQQRFTHLHQHIYLVTVVLDPLTPTYLPQTTIFLVSQQGQGPVIGGFLHHVVCIDGLHVWVGSQLKSIGVVQFFQQRWVGSLIFLNLNCTSLKQTPLLHCLQLVRLQIQQNWFTHLKELLLNRILNHRYAVLFLILVRKWAPEGWDRHGSLVLHEGRGLSFVWEGGGSTGELRVKNSFSEFLNIVYLLFLCNKKAKIRVGLPKLLEFRSNWCDIELILKFPAAIFEGFIVKENNVRFGELFPCLLRDTNVVVLV